MQTVKTAEEIKALGRNVVLDFGATWCAPCNRFAPTFETVSLLPTFSHIKFAKVDIDEASELVELYEISSVPTTILIKNGVVLEKRAGALNENDLKATIFSHLGSMPVAELPGG